MPREAAIQSAILREWGSHPRVRLWRANAGRALVPTAAGTLRPVTMNVVGCADLIGWAAVNGHAVFLAIECKAPSGRIRASQAAFLGALTRMGGIAIVARSVDDVTAVLGPRVGFE